MIILDIRCRHLPQRCRPIWPFWSPAELLPLYPRFCVYDPRPHSCLLDRYHWLKSLENCYFRSNLWYMVHTASAHV